MTAPRECKESPLPQGVDERLAYTITTTPWAASPTSPTVVVKDTSTSPWADVTTSVTTGSASAAGDVITTPYIFGLTKNHDYRVEVKWSVGSAIYECYFVLNAQE